MILNIKIQPNSKENKVVESVENTLKIKIKSPAIEGKANKELVEFLSEYYNVPKSLIAIKSGLNSRNKIIEILN
jgi:uncharacterized protein (TIGR00251 family)